MQYALPENGVVFYAFAAGLLRLEVHVNASLSVWGQLALLSTGHLASTVPPAAAAAWPPQLAAITLCGLRMAGVVFDLQCAFNQGQLACSWQGTGTAWCNAGG